MQDVHPYNGRFFHYQSIADEASTVFLALPVGRLKQMKRSPLTQNSYRDVAVSFNTVATKSNGERSVDSSYSDTDIYTDHEIQVILLF